MGIDAYKVRATRLAKYLAEAAGIKLPAHQALSAIAAEEGIPRANWNILAAKAKIEPAENNSELIVGFPGSGKSVYARQRVVDALAGGRPVVIFSALGDYDRFVQELGGTVHHINADGTASRQVGYRDKLVVVGWNQYGEWKSTPPMPDLKELGFQKQDLREILIVFDETHHYIRSSWLLRMLSAVGEHECAQALLICQQCTTDVAPAIVLAKIKQVRLFKLGGSLAFQDFALDPDLVKAVLDLERHASVAGYIAVSDASALQHVGKQAQQAVLLNHNLKIAIRANRTVKLHVALGITAIRSDQDEIYLEVSSEAEDDQLAMSLLPWELAPPTTVRIVGVGGHDVTRRSVWRSCLQTLTSLGHSVSVSSVAGSGTEIG